MLDPGCLRSGCQHGWILARSLFFQLLVVSSHGEEQREEASSLVNLTSVLIPLMRAPSSCPHQILIISPKPHLLIPSYGGIGFQHMIWGGGDTNIQSITESDDFNKLSEQLLLVLLFFKDRPFPRDLVLLLTTVSAEGAVLNDCLCSVSEYCLFFTSHYHAPLGCVLGCSVTLCWASSTWGGIPPLHAIFCRLE